MGIASRLDTKLGCTFVVWQGGATLEQWHRHFDRLLADPRFPPGRSWLADARRANVDLFDADAIAAMGARMNEAAEHLGGMRMAIVPNGAWHKANKLFEEEVTIQRLTTLQFTSFHTACVWLGLPIEEASLIVEELRTEATTDN